MKCQDVQQWLGVYWDMPEGDDRRRAVDEHIAGCESCREEFAIWSESAELIRDTAFSEEKPVLFEPISGQVMKRIYSDESWRIPVPQRMYSFSYKLKRNLNFVVAFCMTMFVFGFVFSLTTKEDTSPMYGLKPVASATTDVQTVAGKVKSALPVSTMTASLKDPYMIKVGPLRSVPDYMVVISLLGLTGTILTMNWLSRTKA